MAWCRNATSHSLSHCWPRSMSPNGVTRPQWVKKYTYSHRLEVEMFSINMSMIELKSLVRVTLSFISNLYPSLDFVFFLKCTAYKGGGRDGRGTEGGREREGGGSVNVRHMKRYHCRWLCNRKIFTSTIYFHKFCPEERWRIWRRRTWIWCIMKCFACKWNFLVDIEHLEICNSDRIGQPVLKLNALRQSYCKILNGSCKMTKLANFYKTTYHEIRKCHSLYHIALSMRSYFIQASWWCIYTAIYMVIHGVRSNLNKFRFFHSIL